MPEPAREGSSRSTSTADPAPRRAVRLLARVPRPRPARRRGPASGWAGPRPAAARPPGATASSGAICCCPPCSSRGDAATWRRPRDRGRGRRDRRAFRRPRPLRPRGPRAGPHPDRARATRRGLARCSTRRWSPVTAGELSPIVTGIVYCGVILACQDAYEVAPRARVDRRALGWCERQPDLVAFTGRCLVHRAEIMQLGGAWSGCARGSAAGSRALPAGRESGGGRRGLLPAGRDPPPARRLRRGGGGLP